MNYFLIILMVYTMLIALFTIVLKGGFSKFIVMFLIIPILSVFFIVKETKGFIKMIIVNIKKIFDKNKKMRYNKEKELNNG